MGEGSVFVLDWVGVFLRCLRMGEGAVSFLGWVGVLLRCLRMAKARRFMSM